VEFNTESFKAHIQYALFSKIKVRNSMGLNHGKLLQNYCLPISACLMQRQTAICNRELSRCPTLTAKKICRISCMEKSLLLGSVRLCFAAVCVLMDIAPERTDGAAKKTVRGFYIIKINYFIIGQN
jgi:hypothetical protein